VFPRSDCHPTLRIILNIYGGVRILSYDGIEYEFDYFRLYWITHFPGPEWDDINSLYKQYPVEPMGIFSDDYYDIGHYIPTIPRWGKTWKEGHLEYVGVLRNGLNNKITDSADKKTISTAFDYIYANIKSLEYQKGAKLLHNDFHPKNIIVHEGRLSGVTDWECSQFGEADFELSRLFDWCVYPENYLEEKNDG